MPASSEATAAETGAGAVDVEVVAGAGAGSGWVGELAAGSVGGVVSAGSFEEDAVASLVGGASAMFAIVLLLRCSIPREKPC